MFGKYFPQLLLSHNGLGAFFCSVIGQLFVRQLKAKTISEALAVKIIKTMFTWGILHYKGEVVSCSSALILLLDSETRDS